MIVFYSIAAGRVNPNHTGGFVFSFELKQVFRAAFFVLIWGCGQRYDGGASFNSPAPTQYQTIRTGVVYMAIRSSCLGLTVFFLFAAAACGGGEPIALGGGGGASSSSSSASSGASSGSMGAGGQGGAASLDKFSFFVTSLKALQELSGSALGFGGDLRFGESGPGAGLRGADNICSAIAEMSMPGSSQKQWRAFLSISKDEKGMQVNAIDRIGEGPWYDRLGRVVSNNKADLLNDRPASADPQIIDDLPNENGIPNKRPDPNLPEEDNHHMLTGSNKQGMLMGAMSTCLDWTSNKGEPLTEGKPQCGLAFPRMSPMMTSDSRNWISALMETGCAPGVNLLPSGPPGPEDVDVGNGGGYGGFYCFALMP